MRSRRITLIVLGLCTLAYDISGQDRPIPIADQQYHKPHRYLPGVSVTRPAFIHAPTLNDPMDNECNECQNHQSRSSLHHLVYETLDLDGALEPVVTGVGQYVSFEEYQLSFYGGAEIIAWSTNSPSVQPLITTSPTGTPQAQAGVLGQAGTTTLFGGGLFDDSRVGGRYTGAIVFSGPQRWILEATYTMIGDGKVFYQANNNPNIIARPFYNSDASADDARLIVFPGLATGFADIEAKTTFDTFQLAFRRALGQPIAGANADYTIGYRKASLDEYLQIMDISNVSSGPVAGSRFEVRDSFRVNNQFDGVDLGVVMRMQRSPKLALDLLAKLALGRSESVVRIDGRTITRPAGGIRAGQSGGLLTQGTNIGTFRDTSFSTMFEFGATLRYQFTPHVQGTVGYTLLTWQDVARVANQLDSAVNPTQFNGGALIGDPRPRFRFNQDDFVAHGLRAGIQIMF